MLGAGDLRGDRVVAVMQSALAMHTQGAPVTLPNLQRLFMGGGRRKESDFDPN